MSASEPSRASIAPWLGIVVGGAVMAYAVTGMLDDLDTSEERVDWVRWIVGLDILHDLVFAPLVVAVGWLFVRRLPSWSRAPVAFGLATSFVVGFLAWHPLHDSGARAGNPSIQPLDYTTSTLTALALVWAVALGWAVRRAVRR